MYPNERARTGSTALFVALHNRMLAREARTRPASQRACVLCARKSVETWRRMMRWTRDILLHVYCSRPWSPVALSTWLPS